MDFTGELGGALALAFGSGCAAGYGFAVRTMVKESRARISELKSEIMALREELKQEREARLAELKGE